MYQVNEQSTAYLGVTFSGLGTSTVPTSISYRIDDQATGQSIRGATAVSPAATVQITLDPTDNTLVTPTAPAEVHIVTITAPYGTSEQVVGVFKYQVINLTYV